MKINYIKLAKGIASFIVATGTSAIVKTIIKENVEPKNRFSAISVAVGTFAIGGLVSEHAVKYTMRRIDKAIASWNEHVEFHHMYIPNVEEESEKETEKVSQ